MSKYEWERGKIVLPSAEYAKVKKAVEEAANRNAQRLYDEAQKFWKLLPAKARADNETYHTWRRAYVYGENKPGMCLYDKAIPSFPELAGDEAFVDDVDRLLHEVAGRRALKTDCAFVTNRTLRFDCGEPSITFGPNGRTVVWNVPENNHACDTARDHPVARALFAALRRVQWTRGSGGEIVGNDEYNRDSDYAGGGGNYVVETFGLKATKEARWR